MPHLVYKTIIVEDGEETEEEDANKVMNNDVTAPSEASLNNSLRSICGGVPQEHSQMFTAIQGPSGP